LSDIDGLYTANPREDATARHLAEVIEITAEIEAMAGGTGTVGAKGGMKTKILAAKTAMQGGCAMAVMKGNAERPLSALAAGARATWFRPQASVAAARKQWIAGMKPIGALIVDPGAVAALRQGRSLLPAGVMRVDGRFQRGDPVTILTDAGETIGAAITGYSSGEARSIAGQKSDRIPDILGYPGRAALVHRDDMVIWGM
jgi:glutamate 5-kinase